LIDNSRRMPARVGAGTVPAGSRRLVPMSICAIVVWHYIHGVSPGFVVEQQRIGFVPDAANQFLVGKVINAISLTRILVLILALVLEEQLRLLGYFPDQFLVGKVIEARHMADFRLFLKHSKL
jgi:hypothetical protein